jgi:hypothetical protein
MTEERRSYAGLGTFCRSETRARRLILLSIVLLAPWPGQCRAADAAADLRPLELALPKPRFIGTPFHLRTPALERPRSGPRPPLLVPAGTTNVALHKPVTASDSQPTLGDLTQFTDGDKEGIEGSYVEIGPGRQYFQVDLGESYRLVAVVLWHYHNQARVYRDVVVQIADDADFAGRVTTLFNNDHDNSSGLGVGRDREYIETHEGRLIEVADARGRYVRIYGNGNTDNDLNHGTEIEVYGVR